MTPRLMSARLLSRILFLPPLISFSLGSELLAASDLLALPGDFPGDVLRDLTPLPFLFFFFSNELGTSYLNLPGGSVLNLGTLAGDSDSSFLVMSNWVPIGEMPPNVVFGAKAVVFGDFWLSCGVPLL